jgi:hypothetical protein
MSSNKLENSQDFQKLYNSLKDEYNQALSDNNEICKEYESTIELLQETLTKSNAEKEKLQVKNKEKLLDIQDLTKLNDKLKEDIKKIKDEKKLKETKIVFLENDNEHYQSKIRQYEAIIDDLNSQLESTLEENITLQTEFEIYKQTTNEELMRKDEELQDCKSDIINKEKIIQHLNTKKMMATIEEKMKMNQNSLQKYQRKYSEKSFEINKKKGLKINSSMTNVNDNKTNNEEDLQNRTTIEDNKTDTKEKHDDYLVTPILNFKAVLPGKFQEIYKKSIKNVLKYTTPIRTKTVNNNEYINDFNSHNNNNKEKTMKKTTLFNFDSQESSTTQPKVNDNEKERELKLIEHDDSSSSFSVDKKIFEDLVISNEKVFSLCSAKSLGDKLMKNKKIRENLQKLLTLTQQKRNNLISRQKNINNRLYKVGYKIRE